MLLWGFIYLFFLTAMLFLFSYFDASNAETYKLVIMLSKAYFSHFFLFYITGYGTIGEHTSCVPKHIITLYQVSSAWRWLCT